MNIKGEHRNNWFLAKQTKCMLITYFQMINKAGKFQNRTQRRIQRPVSHSLLLNYSEIVLFSYSILTFPQTGERHECFVGFAENAQHFKLLDDDLNSSRFRGTRNFRS
jgi:hypothetical protein